MLPFDGGPAEQALRTQTVQVIRDAGQVDGAGAGHRTRRGDRPAGDDPAGRAGRRRRWSEIARTAHVLAFVVIANRRYTDLFEWGQRTTPFTLSGEIQRRLLPGSFTCEAGAFTLSGWLEPAASIGGDTFDYSVARDVLHVSVTDAMGHGVASALTATLGVGSLRNTRRRGDDLVAQADAPNADLAEHADVPGSLRHRGARPARPAHRVLRAAQRRARAAAAGPRRARTGRCELPANFPLGMFPEADLPQPARSRCGPVTGWSWSPTGCANATPPTWTCRPLLRSIAASAPARGGPGAGRRGAGGQPDRLWPTTPPCSSSTGTAGTASSGTAAPAPTGPAPARPARIDYRTVASSAEGTSASAACTLS